MLVLRARFVISGVTPDHIPAIPLQWKAEKPAHIFKTSGHFISNSVNSRPSFKKKKKRAVFLPLFLLGLSVGGRVILLASHPTEVRIITVGSVEQDSIFPSLLCFWNERTKSIAPVCLWVHHSSVQRVEIKQSQRLQMKNHPWKKRIGNGPLWISNA